MSQCEHRNTDTYTAGIPGVNGGRIVLCRDCKEVIKRISHAPSNMKYGTRKLSLTPGPMSTLDFLPPMPTTLRPAGNRCVVRMLDVTEKTTASGLVIPDTAQNKSQIGEVLAMGPGILLDDGSYLLTEDFKVGDKVVVPKYAGNEVRIDGQDFITLKIDEVLAVVVEEE